jgi:hypothetical protein
MKIVGGVLVALLTFAGSPAAHHAQPAFEQAALSNPRSRSAWPGVTSDNWSGYGGVTSAGYRVTYTSARWKVPSVAPKSGFSSSWVGVDGFKNSSLIQTGTDQYATKGKLTYRAWWEILPAGEKIIHSLSVSPGDTMVGTVQQVSGSSWRITLENVTTGKSFSTTKTYHGPATSAEWIVEAPRGAHGILRLAHYGQTTFSNITLGLNSQAPSAVDLVYPGEAIAMVHGKAQISTPSKPAGNAFNIAYGKEQPKPPKK